MASQQRPSADARIPPRVASYPECPTCRRRMTVKQIEPVLFATGIDDIVYRCEECGVETKRTVKRN